MTSYRVTFSPHYDNLFIAHAHIHKLKMSNIDCTSHCLTNKHTKLLIKEIIHVMQLLYKEAMRKRKTNITVKAATPYDSAPRNHDLLAFL